MTTSMKRLSSIAQTKLFSRATRPRSKAGRRGNEVTWPSGLTSVNDGNARCHVVVTFRQSLKLQAALGLVELPGQRTALFSTPAQALLAGDVTNTSPFEIGRRLSDNG